MAEESRPIRSGIYQALVDGFTGTRPKINQGCHRGGYHARPAQPPEAVNAPMRYARTDYWSTRQGSLAARR